MQLDNEVLVGVDGSPESDAAVAWAVREARARECGLAIVHACDPHAYGLWFTTNFIREGIRDLTHPIVDRAITKAKDLEPTVTVRGQVLVAAPARSLLHLSTDAELVVLGCSGQGALSRLILGSITTRVLANANCPVVAVHRTSAAGTVARVVVGVAVPITQSLSMRFAFEEAARQQCGVVALHVVDDEQSLQRAKVDLEGALAVWRTQYPSIELDASVSSGERADVIGQFCGDRDLLVLGHYRNAGFVPHTLGHLSTDVLVAAPCPVAVVHEPATT